MYCNSCRKVIGSPIDCLFPLYSVLQRSRMEVLLLEFDHLYLDVYNLALYGHSPDAWIYAVRQPYTDTSHVMAVFLQHKNTVEGEQVWTFRTRTKQFSASERKGSCNF